MNAKWLYVEIKYGWCLFDNIFFFIIIHSKLVTGTSPMKIMWIYLMPEKGHGKTDLPEHFA